MSLGKCYTSSFDILSHRVVDLNHKQYDSSCSPSLWVDFYVTFVKKKVSKKVYVYKPSLRLLTMAVKVRVTKCHQRTFRSPVNTLGLRMQCQRELYSVCHQ